MLLNSPDITFQRFQRIPILIVGTADTAISQISGLKAALALKSNEYAVLIRAVSIITVSGAGADGDDLFSIFTRVYPGGSSTPFQTLWRETIAQASLTEGTTHLRPLPYNSDSPKGAPHPIYLFSDEEVYVSISAGGAKVVYILNFNTTWAVFKREVREKAVLPMLDS